MQKTPYDIVVFLVVVSGLIIFMVAFIVFMLYFNRKKQQSFEKVHRMRARTYKWLEMAGGFTDGQKVTLQSKLDALQERLTTMKHG